jgi:hypothetical protein
MNTPCNTSLHVTSDVIAACKLIASTYYGERGLWAYEAFERINATYFANGLPWPFIQWAITPHGGCLGQTSRRSAPVITLHPSLLGGTQKPNPWGIDPALLGVYFAYDILLHECIHVSVGYVLGGATGPTSHNNPQWISEVNRLAPMIGLPVTAAASKTKRIADETGKKSRVVRTTDSSVPFAAVATFPYGVRKHLDELNVYLNGATAEGGE